MQCKSMPEILYGRPLQTTPDVSVAHRPVRCRMPVQCMAVHTLPSSSVSYQRSAASRQSVASIWVPCNPCQALSAGWPQVAESAQSAAPITHARMCCRVMCCRVHLPMLCIDRPKRTTAMMCRYRQQPQHAHHDASLHEGPATPHKHNLPKGVAQALDQQYRAGTWASTSSTEKTDCSAPLRE